jgi:hypothetical protein
MNTPGRRFYAVLWMACVLPAATCWTLLIIAVIEDQFINHRPGTRWDEPIGWGILLTVPPLVLLLVRWIATGRWRGGWHW